MLLAPFPSHAYRAILVLAAWLSALLFHGFAGAQTKATLSDSEVTLQSQYWLDQSGKATIEQITLATADPFQPLLKHRSFSLTNQSALWIRLDLPAANANERWFLQLSSGTFFDRASLYQRTQTGQWQQQRAGDHLPVAQWDHPDQTPVFQLDLLTASTVWLRLVR